MRGKKLKPSCMSMKCIFSFMAQQAHAAAGSHPLWFHDLFVFLGDHFPISEVYIDPLRCTIPGCSQFITLTRSNGARLFLVSFFFCELCFSFFDGVRCFNCLYNNCRKSYDVNGSKFRQQRGLTCVVVAKYPFVTRDN